MAGSGTEVAVAARLPKCRKEALAWRSLACLLYGWWWVFRRRRPEGEGDWVVGLARRREDAEAVAVLRVDVVSTRQDEAGC